MSGDARVASRDEHGRRYWPSCQQTAGHGGSHRSGHFQDVMWIWSDDEAMTVAEVDAWSRGDR